MEHEIAIPLMGTILTGIWLIIDYGWMKWAGLSPIWGSIKQKKTSYKVGVFAFGIAFHYLVFCAIIIILFKVSNRLAAAFAYGKAITWFCIIMIAIHLAARLGMSYYIRKEDDGNALIVNGVITGVILVVGLMGLYVWKAF